MGSPEQFKSGYAIALEEMFAQGIITSGAEFLTNKAEEKGLLSELLRISGAYYEALKIKNTSGEFSPASDKAHTEMTALGEEMKQLEKKLEE